ncbi:MAG: PAS domain S-box protein [Bacteroidota bacterium]
MKKQISFLVALGFILLICMSLLTCFILINQLNRNTEQTQNLVNLTTNVRYSTRKLISDYLLQGEALSSVLLGVDTSGQMEKKLHSDSASISHLFLALSTTKSENLKILLNELKAYDRSVTDSLENSILSLAKTDVDSAKRLYLIHYLQARQNNIAMVRKGIAFSNLEITEELQRSRTSADKVRSFGWNAMGVLGIAGILLGFIFTKSVRSISHQLENSFNRNKLIMENVLDLVCSLDGNGIFRSVNHAALRLLGYNSEELIGRSLFDFIKQQDIEKIKHLLSEIISVKNAAFFETICIRKDNREITMTWSVQWSSPGGLLFCVGHDITDRKQANAVQSLLAAIVDSSEDAIFSRTLKNKIMSWNPGAERLFGYTKGEIKRNSTSVIVPPNYQDEFPNFIERITRGEHIDRYETVRVRKDGRFINVSLTISPIKTQAGKIVGLSTIARDITEEKNLRKQVEESTRRRAEQLRQFAAKIQQVQEEERHHIARELHDSLGQHLSGTKMKVEECLDDNWLAGDQKLERLRSIKNQIELMIDEIRRLSANLRPLALDNFGLVAALKLLCKDFEKNHSLLVHFETNDASLRHFDTQIEIALYRIAQEALTNIAKHAQVTEARLSFDSTGDRLLLSIKDEGIGFQYPQQIAAESGGQGFGILSMKERTELLGGTFSIGSTLNSGTVLTAQIPIHGD